MKEFINDCLIFVRNPIFIRKTYGKDKSLIEVYKILTKHPENGKNLPRRKFLSRTGLDEIPQLINILKGEMSWVGMRPHPKEELLNMSEEDICIYTTYKPGFLGCTFAFKDFDTKNSAHTKIANRRYYNMCKKHEKRIIDTLIVPKILYNKIRRDDW